MVTFIKSANQTAVHAQDVVQYTFTIKNNLPYPLQNVYILDPLSPKLSLLDDSLFPRPLPGESLDTGISLPDVPPGGTQTLHYAVILPPKSTGIIPNTAQLFFAYRQDTVQYDSLYSNTVFLNVE